ncbi:MAG: hypothetical protein H8E42_06150 [Nitrospinae bacterium]|nr:hypothetical protein [Nitrospinota bacterium]MBL7020463.1 hypothetical protein [Nitrospinaceae bacterium]
MKTFIADKEHSEKKIFDKWNGLFPTSKTYRKVISYSKDFQIVRPTKTKSDENEPFLICIKNGYKDNDFKEIKKTLLSIDDTTTMRADCSGPVDKKKLEKEYGWKEGRDYKLRTANSFYTKNEKTGEWNELAQGQELNSLSLGYKRDSFTGEIGLSGWAKENHDRWETLQKISTINETAFQKAFPEKHKAQKLFCEKHIKESHRIGIYTALSANQFKEEETEQMSFHIDKGNAKFEFTSMCVFRVGKYKGELCSFLVYEE